MMLSSSGPTRRRVENTWAYLYDLLSVILPSYLIFCGITINMVLLIVLYNKVVH